MLEIALVSRMEILFPGSQMILNLILFKKYNIDVCIFR